MKVAHQLTCTAQASNLEGCHRFWWHCVKGGRAPSVLDSRAWPPMEPAARRKGPKVKVAIPREVKNHEYRVAITPAGVNEFTRSGHEVIVQAGAGDGSSITDEEFAAAGAKIVADVDEVL